MAYWLVSGMEGIFEITYYNHSFEDQTLVPA